MFRFLVVEDISDTLEGLVHLLKETFPRCSVLTAATVAQGLDRLRGAYQQNAPFDVAILDFNLPRERGANTEIDVGLCDTARRLMPSLLVVHITGYMEDEKVVDHILNAHNGAEDRRFLVSKSDPRWGGTLIRELERYLYSGLLNSEMDDLFEPDAGAGVGRRLKREGHVTHQLATLKLDLREYWEKPLDERVRDRVRRHFEVQDGDFILRIPEKNVP